MEEDFECCYENFLNFDLKRLHIKQSVFSEYHTINGKPLTIEDLETLDVCFIDGQSSNFKLVNFNGLNYLKGENSIYPCSIVLKSTSGQKWVELLIIPNGNKILFSQKSNVIRFNSNNIFDAYSKISNPDILNKFLNNYTESFGENDWFSKTELIQIIKRSSLTINEKFNFLYKKGFLNPFQLAVSSIHFGIRISKHDLYNSLLVNNDVPLGIDYITAPSFKIKLAKSSIQLISNESFKEYVFSMDEDEINSFFELDLIREFLSKKEVYEDLIFDILSIDDLKRNDVNKFGIPGWRYKIEKMKNIGLNIDFIKCYYSKLLLNLRSIENTIRKNDGYNLVGSLYNETLLFKMISDTFPEVTLISQYSPPWLGRQRFDIFIKEKNLAIEYNGKQHYEPIDYYGGTEGFNNTKKRDEEKRRKCKLNDCNLIEVKYDEDFQICIEKIKHLMNSKY
ncbi:hypothetical protein [Algoriphagus sp. CAU 1675]|uniref:hypothetical protein n=1 Tax=Algoriphagus sp. CAU 1675 TaxID=3032597 RepID=UPI0023DCC8AA|nr:hypothetical protein [Algoriphagus sp. CAU 1675]MDF2158335.1 hypothetical protein [Algoriphagus sp. CAU 1675]